jgi:RNA-splicing ligase RtcB
MVYDVAHNLPKIQEYEVDGGVRKLFAVAVSQPELLAEEASYAYKDVSQVVRACEGAGLSRTVAGLRPVEVLKG